MPSRAPEFASATDFYGKLVVKAGEWEATATKKPWSSWWFPAKDTYLFQGRGSQLSPLEKYDVFAQRKFGKKTKAALFEKEKLYDPDAVSWEGLCHAWAVASVRLLEPKQSRQILGISFGVGDLKALLVKTFEDVTGLEKHGQRYNGNRQSVFDDLYPEQFHKLLQVTLFDRGQAFIMDKDPGPAVWNTPVYRAQMRIEPDLSDARVFHVTTWLHGASPFVNTYDYVGTLSVIFEYTYDLVGYSLGDGTLDVQFGEWTGESLDYHPDFVTLVPEQIGHQSKNPEIDLDIVAELLQLRAKMPETISIEK